MHTMHGKWKHRHRYYSRVFRLLQGKGPKFWCILVVGLYFLWQRGLLSSNNSKNYDSSDANLLRRSKFFRGLDEKGLRAIRLSQRNYDIMENTSVVYASTPTDHARNYPSYDSLLTVIQRWSPDVPDPPPTFKEKLVHFNYSNPAERRMAESYRNAEVPFKLYDVPEFTELSKKWTDEYLAHSMGSTHIEVESAKSNHFMYWSDNNFAQNYKDYKPPTERVNMRFDEWVQYATVADVTKLNKDTEHLYFMASTDAGDMGRSFIARDLRLFSSHKNTFFVPNVKANKGVQCRFSMRGIVTEPHFDSGRNFVSMIKGNKRYILTQPSSCKHLDIISDATHPAYRHSAIDWSNEAEIKSRGFDNVVAIDTVVRQGEVLYIPAYWFHYIIALQYSVQCNSRSGAPPNGEGQDEIEDCLQKKFRFKDGKAIAGQK
jgi:hypothetical protein